ncbi:MAG: DegT/DnrJ/EryC1/StrS family aminotransferase, partial [Actinomycetota bacterium]|nr:DegT/DnrJ/EryC1/StrS family aminotransferase [Actinomycetota bacterium]
VADGDRDEFAETLRSRGVQCGVYYPTPIHLLPSFSFDLQLPNTEVAAQTCLSIPVHPALSSVELEAIIESVNAVAGELS